MKIVLISGLSGSGKSVALKLLEDIDYYCVDNLPLEILPALVMHHIERQEVDKLGIGVDIRSRIHTAQVKKQIDFLREQGHQVDILFLEADEATLMRRFSETRRRHPLANEFPSLQQSLQQERNLLDALRNIAYCIDTSKTNSQQLRHIVQKWLNAEHQGMTVVVESFGFKYGLPTNADFVFDMRSLPNPYYNPELRPFNGTQPEIQNFLDQQADVQQMIDDIEQFMHRRLQQTRQESRSYVTIGIGCTGGQHRSVYVTEKLAQRLRNHYPVLIRHRQLEK